MFRAVLTVSMIFGVAMLCEVGADAQTKTKDKDTATKKVEEKKKDAAAAGGIEIYKGKNGFRYRIVDADGKTVAMPIPNAAWDTKEGVLKAIDALKETLSKAKPVEVKE